MAHPDSPSLRENTDTDTLSLHHLTLSPGVLAPYIFPATRKLQPATVSLALRLTSGFASAASADALDQNTLHYGELAKAISRAHCEDGGERTLAQTLRGVEGVVDGLAARRDGTSRVRRCEVRVWLPKASVAGNGVEVVRVREGGRGSVRAGWRGVRVMVVVGVNAAERTGRQVVEVDLEVEGVEGQGEEVLGEERDVAIFGLEREMVEIIEPTTFETLESLGEHIVQHLRPKISEALPCCHRMSLTMRKPKAVAFAEAPALTLVRVLSPASAGIAVGEGGCAADHGTPLRLIKPYG